MGSFTFNRMSSNNSLTKKHDDFLPSASVHVIPQQPIFRPRGALARALYDKILSDEQLKELDKRVWYHCNLNDAPKDLACLFHQLGPDADTNEFMARAEEQSDWFFTQLWHAVAKAFLAPFMTKTSINGWLGRGSMFVISLDQFRCLLNINKYWMGESLLDLGAGDGAVTAKLAPIFQNVYVTEISKPMQTLLQKQKFRILGIDTWHLQNKFDVITCLNLLDRCERPLDILKNIRDSLTPRGRALIALVIPYRSYVECKTLKDRQKLNITGATFEDQIASVERDVLKPNGFTLVKWSKVPYLCEGDLWQSYYYLDDALFVVERA